MNRKLYYYIEEEKKKIIDERERKKILEAEERRKEEIRELRINLAVISILLSNLHYWKNREIFDRNKKHLKEERIILQTIEKIKEQLLVRKDTDLIITREARPYLKEISLRLFNEGISLEHDLTKIKENSPWTNKLERDKVLNKNDDMGLFLRK